MNEANYCDLKPGDLVRHKMSGSAMVVIEIVGGTPVLARYTAMRNPSEWDRVSASGEVLG
jgi:hypothetical protein